MKTRDIDAKPRYIPAQKERLLGYIKGSRIYTEDKRILEFDSLPSFLALCQEQQLLLFVAELGSFTYLSHFIEHGSVFCTAEGLPRYASVRYGKKHFSIIIVQSSTWGIMHPTLPFLKVLRGLFTLCAIGVHATPGAMGYGLYAWSQFEQYGQDWRAHRHIRAGAGASYFLGLNKRGARIELYANPQNIYDQVDELDKSNAYPECYRIQPQGKSYKFLGSDCAPYAWYEAACHVTLPHDFAYGLVGSKYINGEVLDEMQWIRLKGEYDLILGKYEIELLEEAGCEVEVQGGYGWYSFTKDPDLFVNKLIDLRKRAPNRLVAGYIKKCGLAGIGRDGMDQEFYQLVPAKQRKDGDKPLVMRDGKVSTYFVSASIDTAPKSMPHWYAHTTEMLRVEMTQVLFKFDGEALALNTDGLYVIRSERSQAYPEKSSIESGQIGRIEHSGVQFPECGHIDAFSGKHRHPGKRRKK